jgi:hypothetical protein
MSPRGAGNIVGLLNELDRGIAVEDVDSLLDKALPQDESPLEPLPPIPGVSVSGAQVAASTDLADIRDVNIRTDVAYVPVAKIISGGQTGADIMGLLVANHLGIETGGTAAPGYAIENKGWYPEFILRATGMNPVQLQKELGLVPYKSPEGLSFVGGLRHRTTVNARNATATIFFGNVKSGGGRATESAAQGKPFLVIPNGTPIIDAAREIRRFLDRLQDNNITLNIAGNRISTNPGVYELTRKSLQAALSPEVVIPQERLMPEQVQVFGVSPSQVQYRTEQQMKETDDQRWEIPDKQDRIDETGDVVHPAPGRYWYKGNSLMPNPSVSPKANQYVEIVARGAKGTVSVRFPDGSIETVGKTDLEAVGARVSFLKSHPDSLVGMMLDDVSSVVRGIGAAFLNKHMALKHAQRKHQLYQSAIKTYIKSARQLARQAESGAIDKKSYNQLRMQLKSKTAIWLEARLKIVDQLAYAWQYDQTDVAGQQRRGRAAGEISPNEVAVKRPPRTNLNFLLSEKGNAYQDIMKKLDRLFYDRWGANWPEKLASVMGELETKSKMTPRMKVSPKKAKDPSVIKWKDRGGNWIYPQYDAAFETMVFVPTNDVDVQQLQDIITEAIKATYHAETKHLERFYLNPSVHPALLANEEKAGDTPAQVKLPHTTKENVEPYITQESTRTKVDTMVDQLYQKVRDARAHEIREYRKQLRLDPRSKVGLKVGQTTPMMSKADVKALITERVFMELDREAMSQPQSSRDTGSGNYLSDHKFGWLYDHESQRFRRYGDGRTDTEYLPYRQWNHSTDADWNAYLDWRVSEIIEQQAEKFVQSGGTMIEEVSFAGQNVWNDQIVHNGQLYNAFESNSTLTDEADPDAARDLSTPEMQLVPDFHEMGIDRSANAINSAQAFTQDMLSTAIDKAYASLDRNNLSKKPVFMAKEIKTLLDAYYGKKNIFEQWLNKSLQQRQKWLVEEFGLKGFKAWPFTIHPRWNPANRAKQIDIGGEMYSIKEVGTAMTLFVDLQQYPEAIPMFYDKLTDEQKRLVDLSQKLPKRVQTWITEQQAYVRDLGVKLSTGKTPVLKADTVLDHYVMHLWLNEKGHQQHPTEVAFSLFTGRTMEREFNDGGILEGWSLGKELAVTDYSANLYTASKHLQSALENQVMMNAGAKAGLFVTKSQLEKMEPKDKAKFVPVNHSSFRMWKKSGRSTGHRVRVTLPNGAKEWGIARGYKQVDAEPTKDMDIELMIKLDAATREEHFEPSPEDEIALQQFREMKQKAMWVAVIERKNGEYIEVPLAQTRPDLKGKDFFVDRMGNIHVAEALYAAEPLAKHWNSVLATSKLRQIPYMDKVLLFNSIAKQGVLMMSLFHQWAFWRSAGLGGAHGLDSLNVLKLQRLGMAAIEEFGPELQSLVYAGMTMGKVLDWDPRLGDKAGAFTKALEKAKWTKNWAPKRWEQLMAIRNQYEQYLFGTVGASLKAQTGLVELRHGMERLKKNPEYLKADSETQQNMEAQVTYAVAKLMNRDFGGMDYERMGVSPTMLDVSRLALLGPDWTISNVMSMYGALQRGDEGYVHRAFWTRIAARTAAITLAWNLMMMPFGDDEFEKAYAAGNLRWMGMNLTPIYHLLGGDRDAGMYFQLAGHFLDPIKFIGHPVQSAKYKSSVVGRIVIDALTGVDFANRRYTTFGELMTSGKTVSWKSNAKAGPISNSQIPSFLLNKKSGTMPIGVQKIGGWITGNNDGFEMFTQLLGMSTQKRYAKRF